MKALHRDPGPRGFAVYSDDDKLLADHLTQEQAFRLLCGDNPPPVTASGDKWSGGPGAVAYMGGTYYSVRQVGHEDRRHKKEWKAHWQGQGPRQYADE